MSSSFLYLVLRRHAGVALSLTGVAAFVMNRSLNIYTCIFEPEVLLVCFMLLFLWSIDSSMRHKELLAGFALSLCILIRPNLLPILAVVPLYLCLCDSGQNWRRSTTLLTAFPLLVLALLTVRNHSVGGGFSPVVMNPGFVFFEANNPLASGQSAVYPPLVAELRNEIHDQPDNPHATYRTLARIESVEQLSTAEINRYWLSKSLNYISDFPLNWVRLEAHKFFVLWHEHRRYDLLEAYNTDRLFRERHLPFFPFALVSSCALFGLFLTRHEWRRYLLYYAFFAIQAVSMLIFYVSDRQRLALLPLFILFACAGVSKAFTTSVLKRTLICTGGVLSCVLFSVPSNRMRDDLYLWDSDQRCNQLWSYAGGMRAAGNIQEASDSYALSFAVAPWVEDYSRPDHISYQPGGFAARSVALWPRLERSGPSARFDKGIILLAAGQLPESELIFKEQIASMSQFDRGHLQSSLPEYYLGQIALRRGNPEQARQWFERALELVPGEPFVLAQLAALTGKESYHSRLLRYFGKTEHDWLVGRALFEQGKSLEAQETLARLHAGLPDFRRAMIYLAAANGAAGNIDQGAELYMRAIAERPAPVILEAPILKLFSSLVSLQPGNYNVYYRQGLVLSQYGFFPEGLAALDRAYSIQPSDDIARERQNIRMYLQ